MSCVLVVAVHPDDETLGCGGTLLKHAEAGDDIYWLTITSVKEKFGYSKDFVQKRKCEITEVFDAYKFKKAFHLDFPTTRLDEVSVSEMVGQISAIFEEIEPNILYLPFKNDVHTDHRIVFDATYSCTKSFRYPSIKKVLMMETLSETEFAPSTASTTFIPNVFTDISKYMDEKVAIISIFESELGEHPFPRSVRNIKALATLRGASSNCEYAESFMLLKEIL